MAHPVRRFTKGTFVFFNIIAALCFLLGSYGYIFNPTQYWFTGFFTLGAFYLLLLLIAFLFFWLLVKPRFMLISLAAILMAWVPVQELIQLKVNSEFDVKKNPGTLRVMSWNVEHFKIAEHKTNPQKKADMFRLINMYQPDVACFQEMVGSDSVPAAINYLPDIARELNMPFYYYSYNRKLDFDKDHRFGIIIFSRRPILNKQSVSYGPNDYNSIFQYADIKFEEDTVRIFNLHFQSLKFSSEDMQYIEQPGIDDEVDFKKSKTVVSKFKTGFLKRQVQSERVKKEMDKSPYPVIICGDFNDVPNSYAYYTVGKGLQNAFNRKGAGIGRTYSHISPTLRIDHIFADQRFTVTQYVRNKKKISDHFPIVADLTLQIP